MGVPQARVSRQAGAPAKLGSGSRNTWVEGGRSGWVGHLHPARLVGGMTGENGRNLLSLSPGGNAPSGNGAINGSPWGFASFRALGRRGSGLPWVCGSGRGHRGAWGQLGLLRRGGGSVLFASKPQLKIFPPCLVIAANHSTSKDSGIQAPSPSFPETSQSRLSPSSHSTVVAGRRLRGGGAQAGPGREAGNRAACPDGCMPPSWGVPTL